MKKILLLVLAFTFNILAYDSIEKAILDSDLKKVSTEIRNKITKDGALTDKQTAKYMNLADMIIAKRFDTVSWDRFWPKQETEYNKYSIAAILSTIFGIICPCLYMSQRTVSSSEKEGAVLVMFIGITSAIIFTVLTVAEANEQKVNNKRLYYNALEIKQMFYDL